MRDRPNAPSADVPVGNTDVPATSDHRSDIMTTLDEQIGRRIRDRRRLSGLSQHELAKDLGISHQQLQKYEAGKNRISASRLWRCAEILATPISDFFFDRAAVPAAKDGTDRDRPRVALRA